MNKNQEELERIITDCKFREIPSVLAYAILSAGYVKLSDVELERIIYNYMLPVKERFGNSSLKMDTIEFMKFKKKVKELVQTILSAGYV